MKEQKVGVHIFTKRKTFSSFFFIKIFFFLSKKCLYSTFSRLNHRQRHIYESHLFIIFSSLSSFTPLSLSLLFWHGNKKRIFIFTSIILKRLCSTTIKCRIFLFAEKKKYFLHHSCFIILIQSLVQWFLFSSQFPSKKKK